MNAINVNVINMQPMEVEIMKGETKTVTRVQIPEGSMEPKAMYKYAILQFRAWKAFAKSLGSMYNLFETADGEIHSVPSTHEICDWVTEHIETFDEDMVRLATTALVFEATVKKFDDVDFEESEDFKARIEKHITMVLSARKFAMKPAESIFQTAVPQETTTKKSPKKASPKKATKETVVVDEEEPEKKESKETVPTSAEKKVSEGNRCTECGKKCLGEKCLKHIDGEDHISPREEYSNIAPAEEKTSEEVPVEEKAIEEKPKKKRVTKKKTAEEVPTEEKTSEETPAKEFVPNSAEEKPKKKRVTKKKTAKEFVPNSAEEVPVEEKAIEEEDNDNKSDTSSKNSAEKKKRGPSPYNIFIKEEITRLRAENPELNNKVAMAMAVSAWKKVSPSKKTSVEEEEPTTATTVEAVTLEETLSA